MGPILDHIQIAAKAMNVALSFHDTLHPLLGFAGRPVRRRGTRGPQGMTRSASAQSSPTSRPSMNVFHFAFRSSTSIP